MGSEQEEDEMLILPKAQLGNMLASPTLDLTVTEMHGRTPITSSSLFPFLEHGIGIYMDIWMTAWIHCEHPFTRGRHACVVVFILVA